MAFTAFAVFVGGDFENFNFGARFSMRVRSLEMRRFSDFSSRD
jgi:hypothetical protein